MILALAAIGLLSAGYALGRLQPARRASDWAAWERYGTPPTGLRRIAVRAVLTIDELALAARLLVFHPRRFVHAFKHRNDPPPARGPALEFNATWRNDRDTSAPI